MRQSIRGQFVEMASMRVNVISQVPGLPALIAVVWESALLQLRSLGSLKRMSLLLASAVTPTNNYYHHATEVARSLHRFGSLSRLRIMIF